jgi:hypothetical protein
MPEPRRNPSATLDALLDKHAARARAMPADARDYWPRHEGRFRFVLRYLDEHARSRVRHALDVGASFETRLLADCFPEWRIDTLGDGHDARFVLPPPSRHFTYDLNAVADEARWPDLGTRYDLIVFMEVIEHLNVPPARVLRFLAAQLAAGGTLLLTTPNAAWLKNRLKLLRGQNPFELLREGGGGHIREYTLAELQAAGSEAGLGCVQAQLCGLYGFTGGNDRFYDALANATLPGLRRSIFAVFRK